MTDTEARRRLVDWAIPRLVHKNRAVRHTAVRLLASMGVLTDEECRKMIEGDDL